MEMRVRGVDRRPRKLHGVRVAGGHFPILQQREVLVSPRMVCFNFVCPVPVRGGEREFFSTLTDYIVRTPPRAPESSPPAAMEIF